MNEDDGMKLWRDRYGTPEEQGATTEPVRTPDVDAEIRRFTHPPMFPPLPVPSAREATENMRRVFEDAGYIVDGEGEQAISGFAHALQDFVAPREEPPAIEADEAPKPLGWWALLRALPQAIFTPGAAIGDEAAGNPLEHTIEADMGPSKRRRWPRLRHYMWLRFHCRHGHHWWSNGTPYSVTLGTHMMLEERNGPEECPVRVCVECGRTEAAMLTRVWTGVVIG